MIVDEYVKRIEGVLDGSSQESPQELSDEIISAFTGTINHISSYRGTKGTGKEVSKADLKKLRGRLLVFEGNGYVDPSIQATNGPTVMNEVTATAEANATVYFEYRQFEKELDASDVTKEDSEAIKDLVADLEKAARSGEVGKVLDTLDKLTDHAKRIAGFAAIFIKWAPMILSLFGHAA